MHVLHIDTEKTWRGGENQMRLLMEALKEQGIVCHIAAQPGSEIVTRLGKRFPVFPVAMRSELDIVAARGIARYCREQKIGLIDCQSSHAHGIGLLSKVFFQPKVRLVVHRRVDYQPKPGYINRFKYQHSAVDQYIAISAKIASILRDYGIAKDKVATVPSAVSAEVYTQLSRSAERQRWRAKLGLTDERPLIGQAAAMTDQKGYDTLLRSLAALKTQGRVFHCVLAGDGPLRSGLEVLCRELRLESDVTFLGWSNEVPSLLTSLDIFFMPSNFEGLGTTILEAIFAGCCVVASEVGGIPEIIEDGHSGLLAKPGDHAGFARQLAKVIAAPALRQELNSNARRHIDTNFSLNSMVAGNLAVYRSLLASS